MDKDSLPTTRQLSQSTALVHQQRYMYLSVHMTMQGFWMLYSSSSSHCDTNINLLIISQDYQMKNKNIQGQSAYQLSNWHLNIFLETRLHCKCSDSTLNSLGTLSTDDDDEPRGRRLEVKFTLTALLRTLDSCQLIVHMKFRTSKCQVCHSERTWVICIYVFTECLRQEIYFKLLKWKLFIYLTCMLYIN